MVISLLFWISALAPLLERARLLMWQHLEWLLSNKSKVGRLDLKMIPWEWRRDNCGALLIEQVWSVEVRKSLDKLSIVIPSTLIVTFHGSGIASIDANVASVGVFLVASIDVVVASLDATCIILNHDEFFLNDLSFSIKFLALFVAHMTLLIPQNSSRIRSGRVVYSFPRNKTPGSTPGRPTLIQGSGPVDDCREFKYMAVDEGDELDEADEATSSYADQKQGAQRTT
ncbi:PREDICTED: uncharacterized protein LOC109130454 [Camelina sativa]|uniref:Uncharacterized protein LOC109130454 n=1 Tax=Camelina sativa TaxID=90675 RepID=A0ABM1R973_CAMSA|nr:PREDICTED: uncharacterized protein LOC109130454 [Camelina sativa]